MSATSTIFLPALAAGTVAMAVTIAIERLGGEKGGLLGTLPTTIVPAALGLLARNPDTADFVAAMTIVPAGMLLNALFLLCWRLVPGRLPDRSLRVRLGQMSAISLAVWLVGALGLVSLARLARQSGLGPVFGGASTLLLIGLGAWACHRRPPAPAGRKPVPGRVLLLRGLLSAAAIALALSLKRFGPTVSGVVSVFPAIFLTTMVSLWLAQGEAVPAGAVGPMMLGGSSVAAFALFAAWLLPLLGPLPGSVASWVLAVLCTTLPAWWWLQRTRKAT